MRTPTQTNNSLFDRFWKAYPRKEGKPKALRTFEKLNITEENAVKNSDFSDLKTFVGDYLNTPEPKQRKKLAEEFKKRHLELYAFIKENTELISAETEIAKTVNAVLDGDTANSDDKQLTNLFEIIEGGVKK